MAFNTNNMESSSCYHLQYDKVSNPLSISSMHRIGAKWVWLLVQSGMRDDAKLALLELQSEQLDTQTMTISFYLLTFFFSSSVKHLKSEIMACITLCIYLITSSLIQPCMIHHVTFSDIREHEQRMPMGSYGKNNGLLKNSFSWVHSRRSFWSPKRKKGHNFQD